MTNHKGLFISFEGIDGAGKSTHIGTLAEAFRAQGRTVTMTREPGGSALAEKLRHIVLNDAMDVITEALLVFAARRDHLQTVIEPSLARNEVVLCDRFSDATFAYQGGGRGLDWHMLHTLEQWVQSTEPGLPMRQPELTLWFDVPLDVAAERLRQATRLPDKFEAQTQAFFERVAAAYARRMQASPWRFARIQADHAAHIVWQNVLQVVQNKGWLT
jgi:dTMP kinase